MIGFLRTVRWALWLGWQVESNWTRPWLFALYVVVKPMTGTLLFVCMFEAALSANPEASTGLLAFTFVGNALYMFAGAIGFSMSAALVTDRERKTSANAEAREIDRLCREKGLIFQLRGVGSLLNVIRLVPPMTTSDAEIDRALSIMRDAITAVSRQSPGKFEHNLAAK